LLDLLDERPVELIDHLDPEKNFLTTDKIESLLNGDLDFIICDKLLSEDKELILNCRQEAEQIS
jgi:hypothetical protein